MSDKNKREVSIIGPVDLTDIRVSQPQKYAAGTEAIKIALGHAMKEMGLAKSIATLSKLNQKDGFDCPGCA